MASNNWMQPVRRFFRLISEDKRDITQIYLFAIFSGLISLTLPLGVQAIINIVMGGRVASSWIILVIVVILGTAFVGFLQILQISVTEIVQQRIFVRSSFEFSYRIPRFKITEVLNDHPPELVNRFFDTLNVQKGLPKILTDFPTAILQILFGLVLLSFYHPLFILFGLLLLGLLFSILRFTGPQGLKTSLEESKYKYKVAYWLEELARTMTTFKLAGFTELPLKRTDKLTSKYLVARKSHFKILVSQYIYVVIFKVLITGGLLVIGGFLVINNQINIGQFVAAEIIIIIVLNSSEKLISSLETIYDVLTGLEKIGAIMDIPLDSTDENAIQLDSKSPGLEVELSNLTLQFPQYSVPVLNNLDLHIKQGEKICISGAEGSGKTVLLQVLGGLYTDFKGSLLYNGHPIGSLNLDMLRGIIGDNFSMEDLFDGTLAENVSMGRSYVTNEDILEALNMVGLSDFIKELPEGLLTHIVPGGKRIPVSIVRRIILSRSFAQRPPLLVLDNYPASIEHRVEQLSRVITDASAKWTAVVASNHPVLASKCSRIVIMEKGRIIFDGTWDAVQANPKFMELYQ
jgi:ABC-type bacteriocin/lantibiotic exporter with double-glycine peptidase domain